jgi:hypothetical protein
MARVEDSDTRYFLEIDLKNLRIIKCSFDQKQNLDKGRQSSLSHHRLFLTKGQYKKFVQRFPSELKMILDEN